MWLIGMIDLPIILAYILAYVLMGDWDSFVVDKIEHAVWAIAARPPAEDKGGETWERDRRETEEGRDRQRERGVRKREGREGGARQMDHSIHAELSSGRRLNGGRRATQGTCDTNGSASASGSWDAATKIATQGVRGRGVARPLHALPSYLTSDSPYRTNRGGHGDDFTARG